MATVGTINIAMSTNTSPLSKGLDSAASSVQQFSARIEQTSGLIRGLWAGAIGGAATAAIYKFANAAAHAEEAVNKIGAVFGDEGPRVEQLSRDMAKAYGLSLNDMLDASGRIGSMFQGAGFNSGAVAEYSDSIVRLANDLSRFNDTSFEVAFQKLRSGLAGESEPLRDFGIFLTEAAVKAKAYEMGLAQVGAELTDAQKIQARANIILEKSGPAIGAAAREADGASSKIEAFWGQLENLQITLGETFAPAVGAMLGGLSEGIAVMGQAWTDATTFIADWASGAIESIGLTLEPINILEVAIGGIANACQYVVIGFKALGVVGTAVYTALIKLDALLLDGINYIYTSLTGLESPLADFAESVNVVVDSMWESTKEQAQDVADAWNSPAWSSAVSERFQQVRDEAAALRADLANKPINLPMNVGGSDPGALEKKVSKPFGEALRLGSAEAASTVLRNRFGMGKNSTEENTKRTADGVDKAVATLREIAGGIKGVGNLSIADLS